jgi:hypothetical protein
MEEQTMIKLQLINTENNLVAWERDFNTEDEVKIFRNKFSYWEDGWCKFIEFKTEQ